MNKSILITLMTLVILTGLASAAITDEYATLSLHMDDNGTIIDDSPNNYNFSILNERSASCQGTSPSCESWGSLDFLCTYAGCSPIYDEYYNCIGCEGTPAPCSYFTDEGSCELYHYPYCVWGADTPNAPKYISEGYINGAYDFGQANNDYIKANETIAGNLTTISLWIKTPQMIDETSPTQVLLGSQNDYRFALIFGGFTSDYSDEIMVVIDASSGYATAITASSQSGFQINASTWYHLLLRWSETEGKYEFWVNGERMNTRRSPIYETDAPIINDYDLTIGEHVYGAWGGNSNATIDELKVFGFQVTDQEIQDLYEEGTETPECYDDYDCGTCEYCNATNQCEYQYQTDTKVDCSLCAWCDGAGSCIWQDYGSDIKDECTFTGYTYCDQNVLRMGEADFCDGAGSYLCSVTYTFVPLGHVCVDGEDELASSEHNCGIWSDCVAEETTANEYYVGYDHDLNCVNDDWVSAGTTQEATSGYWWDATEQVDTCSETKKPSSTSAASRGDYYYRDSEGNIYSRDQVEGTRAPTLSIGGIKSINLTELWNKLLTWIKSWWQG